MTEPTFLFRVDDLERDMAESAHSFALIYDLATDIANSDPSEFCSAELTQKARDLVATMDKFVEGVA